MMTVLPLFSSPVVIFNLEENLDEVFQDIVNSVENWTNLAEGQTQIYYPENSEWNLLKKFPVVEKIVMERFYEFISETLECKNNEFKLTTSWLTRTRKGEGVGYHCHKNSHFSGVLYMTEDTNQSQIIFNSPIELLQTMQLSPTSYNLWNSGRWSVPVNRNTLIFFPSYLQHSIAMSTSEVERYSIAFNFFPIGELRHNDSSITVRVD